MPWSVINRSQFFAFFVIITDGIDGEVSIFFLQAKSGDRLTYKLATYLVGVDIDSSVFSNSVFYFHQEFNLKPCS